MSIKQCSTKLSILNDGEIKRNGGAINLPRRDFWKFVFISQSLYFVVLSSKTHCLRQNLCSLFLDNINLLAICSARNWQHRRKYIWTYGVREYFTSDHMIKALNASTLWKYASSLQSLLIHSVTYISFVSALELPIQKKYIFFLLRRWPATLKESNVCWQLKRRQPIKLARLANVISHFYPLVCVDSQLFFCWILRVKSIMWAKSHDRVNFSCVRKFNAEHNCRWFVGIKLVPESFELFVWLW